MRACSDRSFWFSSAHAFLNSATMDSRLVPTVAISLSRFIRAVSRADTRFSSSRTCSVRSDRVWL